jgi:hypothetical protein
MPAITYADFSGGLDRRLPINVQEASKLWTLRNAYITLGKRPRKRHALDLQPGDFYAGVGASPEYYKGLFSYNGRLLTFGTVPATGVAPSVDVDTEHLQTPTSSGQPAELVDVTQAVVFQGFLYVVGLWRDIVTNETFYKHQYLDGVTGIIPDVNCPHSGSIAVAASRIYAIDGEVVRYSAATNATDWTTANDAGFLPVSLQQNTTEPCTAVGTYEDALAVYFPDSVQLWDVAVDPTANQIRKRLSGVGTQSPLSLATFASDQMFLSPVGFRSMRTQYQTDRIDDTDTGVPVDPLVVADLDSREDLSDIFGQWFPQLGQYWCVFPINDTSSKVWVYTYSKSSKIACWSEYTFPVAIRGLAALRDKVYARDDTLLYRLSPAAFTDNGTSVAVEMQLAFQDAKQPGVAKQFYGADFVCSGSPSVSFKYDPRDLDKESVPMTIPSDTRPGDVMPVEIVAPAVAPVFRHELDEEFELDAITLYYNGLGIQV